MEMIIRLWGKAAGAVLFACCCLMISAHPIAGATTFNIIKVNTTQEEEIRSYDGRNNNPEHPDWGAIHTPRIRQFPASPYHEYTDPDLLPSARRVMEELFRKAPPKKDKTVSHLLLEFGHFIVQDLLGSSENMTDPLPIPCDGTLMDYVFCPVTGQGGTMPFFRQTHSTNNTNNTRATINGQTSFLDLSNLYGLSVKTSQRMRGPRGRLIVDHLQLPPRDESLLPEGMKNGMNTTPGAFAFYVLFLRYHNRVADQLYSNNTQYTDDDKIFEMARRQTIAVYQNLVEEGYLPTLLGDKLDPYPGYLPQVDPSMDEFFAAVSFRYAHTNFGPAIRVLDSQFRPTPEDPLFLREVFKQDVPELVRQMGGVEPFLRGLTVTPSKAMDASFVDDLNIWSEATSVLDIQRGRDVGIPPYNEVRETMGLERISSLEELTQNDTVTLQALRHLYNDNVDRVDAYVGAILEPPQSPLDPMGPVLTLSLKDQFTRLRDGDRFWYKNIFDQQEYEVFPTLSQLIQLVCNDMELFPDDPFLLVSNTNPAAQGEGCAAATTNELAFLGGDFLVRWNLDEPADTAVESTDGAIEITLTVMEEMKGDGYIGIGFGKRVMNGADIWFCTVDFERLQALPLPARCAPRSETSGNPGVISCCLATGNHHVVPKCSQPGDKRHYTLEVVEWCLSQEQSSVTVRAITCSSNDEKQAARGDNNSTATTNEDVNGCFEMEPSADGQMDVIVAYNPFSDSRPHGYQRRTAAQIDLFAGRVLQVEAHTADIGLMVTHGAYMLTGWLVLAPMAVFVVRYMKTKSWRLVAHISIMLFVGALMLPLLVGVLASVGSTDKTEVHSIVGLTLVGIFLVMAGTGRFRYIKWQGQTIGRKTDFVTLAIHKGGGVTFIVLAWWNCYTGLGRIGPGSESMGYDISAFGFIRDYLFGPWIAFMAFVFVIAEILKRRSGSAHQKMQDAGSLWDDDGLGLDTMTIQKFLDATRLGNSLCIIDGRVLDITEFASSHPGGPEMLRYVRGSDITEEFLGQRDVDGIRHQHSHTALEFLNTLVIARIVTDTDAEKPTQGRAALPPARRPALLSIQSRAALPFRRAKVIDVQYLAPHVLAIDQKKPVILLRLSMARDGDAGKEDRVTKLPGCSFRFRGIDKKGIMFEREYTAVRIAKQDSRLYMSLANMDAISAKASGPASIARRMGSIVEGETDEECYDFAISLIPGGQMSTFLLGLKTGELLLAQGPKVSPPVVSKFCDPKWKTVVFLASGTGIVPMLQVIDFYLEKKHRDEIPVMFLIWFLRSPNHSFDKTLGLTHRVKASAGRLKLLTIFLSGGEDSSSNASSQLRPGTPFSSIRSLWGQASQYVQGSQECKPATPSPPTPSGGLLAGLLGRQKRAKVRDLVALAQTRTEYSESFFFSTLPEDSALMAFDSDFWTEPVRSMSTAVNQLLVNGLLSSAHEYGAKLLPKVPTLQLVALAGSREQYSPQDWDRLALALRHGVKVKSRTFRLRTYNNCFIGSEAVDVLCRWTHTSRPEALAIGRQLAKRFDFLEHVCDPEVHPELEDGNLWYKFKSRSVAKDSATMAAPDTLITQQQDSREDNGSSNGVNGVDATDRTATESKEEEEEADTIESNEEEEEVDTIAELPTAFEGMKQIITFGISTQQV